MGTIVVTEFVTLDGVMEAPGGEPTHRHSGWVGDCFGEQVGVVEAVTQLKEQVEGIILVAGSGTLVHSAVLDDVVQIDHYRPA